MNRIKISIKGMSCSHCEMRVSNAIKSIEGVSLEKIDLTAAEVSMQDVKQEETIVAAIKAAGYEVIAVQAV